MKPGSIAARIAARLAKPVEPKADFTKFLCLMHHVFSNALEPRSAARAVEVLSLLAPCFNRCGAVPMPGGRVAYPVKFPKAITEEQRAWVEVVLAWMDACKDPDARWAPLIAGLLERLAMEPPMCLVVKKQLLSQLSPGDRRGQFEIKFKGSTSEGCAGIVLGYSIDESGSSILMQHTASVNEVYRQIHAVLHHDGGDRREYASDWTRRNINLRPEGINTEASK